MIPHRKTATSAAAALLLGVLGASCGTAARQTAGSASDRPAATPAQRPDASSLSAAVRHTEADVRFMEGMIHHHEQALDMTALVSDRAQNDAIESLAGRIEISQKDEIARMQRWLTARGEQATAGHDHGLMPGMLTPEEMARLANERGAAFDRLFLELMIRHHEGALIMVDRLQAEGGGREPEIFQLTSHIDADQRAEIARMRGLLSTTPQGGTE